MAGTADKHPWWGPARVPFLFLTPACMSLAVAWSWWQLRLQGLQMDGVQAALCVLGALMAHVGVNALNEYADFKSGLDQRTRKTPFSGGSGTLPARPDLAPIALNMGVGGLSLTALIGLYFLWQEPGRMLSLAPLGVLGLMLVVAYTPWVTRQPWLCLIAPGLGFGPLMALGTEIVLTGQASWTGLMLSVLPFALTNNLLLLNQYPDVEPDRSVGRRTLPMLWGRAGCVPLLAVQYGVAYGVLLLGLALGWWPMGTGLAVLTMPMALTAWQKAKAHADDMAELLPALGLNVGVALATPALAALGMVLSHG